MRQTKALTPQESGSGFTIKIKMNVRAEESSPFSRLSTSDRCGNTRDAVLPLKTLCLCTSITASSFFSGCALQPVNNVPKVVLVRCRNRTNDGVIMHVLEMRIGKAVDASKEG